MTQQVKNLNSVLGIGKTPSNLDPIEFPFTSTTKPSLVSFSSTIELKNFSTTTKWYHDFSEAITSIKVKVDRVVLVLDSNALNSRSAMMYRNVLARLPSFISTRMDQHVC